MPLLPAKCPICGAILNIESKKEAAVCPSCNNAFVVEKAINNYNTYNTITADTVVVQGESEKEQLNKNGETYIKLGSWEKAREAYQQMVEKFPDDYRGWWGLVVCCHREIKTEMDYHNLIWRMEAIAKLAPDDKLLEYRRIIDEKLHEQAVLNAKKNTAQKLGEVKAACSNSETLIQELQPKIQSHLKEIEDADIRLKKQLEIVQQGEKIDLGNGYSYDSLTAVGKYNSSVDGLERCENEVKKASCKKIIWYGICIIAFLFGGSGLKIISAIFLLFSVFLNEFMDAGDSSIIRIMRERTECQKKLDANSQDVRLAVQNLNKNTVSYARRHIEDYNKRIEQAKNTIQSSTELLAYGEDAIYLFYLAQWHKTFELDTISYNSTLKNYLSL